MRREEWNPIFIGGAGRSGTTLLRAMLGCHPRLFAGNEYGFLPMLIDARRALTSKGIPRVSQYGVTEESLDDVFARLVMEIAEAALTANDKLRWVEKTPHNVLCFEDLLRIFPRARCIQVIRDGRDVVASLLDPKNNWGWEINRNLAAAAKYWAQCVLTGAKLRGQTGYAEVRYEDLVARPRRTMMRVLNWLGEPWDDAVLSDTRRKQNVEIEQRESSTQQIKQPINRRAIGRWRRDLNAEQQQAVVKILDRLLKELGYDR